MKSINKIMWLLAIIGIAGACTPEDEVEPFGVNFTNSEVGISTITTTVEVGITFSRAAPAAG